MQPHGFAGDLPIASVLATPLAKGETAPVEPTIVHALRFGDITAAIEQKPRLMHTFFWALAALCSKHLQSQAAEQASLLHAHQRADMIDDNSSSKHFSAAATAMDRSALQVCKDFGLLGVSTAYEADRLLIGACHGSVSIETHSSDVTSDLDAKIFLFTSHLCIEHSILNIFFRRDAYELSEVVALTHPEHDGGTDNQRDGTAKSKLFRQVEIQMRGKSMRITMDPVVCEEFAMAVEEARMQATDFLGEQSKPASHHSDVTLKDRAQDMLRISRETTKTKKKGRRLSAFETGKELYSEALRDSQDVRNENSGSADGQGRGAAGEGRRASRTGRSMSDISRESSVASRRDSVNTPGDMILARRQMSGSSAHAGLQLSTTEWDLLFRGATRKRLPRGTRLVRTDKKLKGILQVVRGSLRAQKDVPGRPQALVVGHMGPGQIVGITSFILGSYPTCDVVVESEDAVVVYLFGRKIYQAFAQLPALAGRFYCFLATHQARMLAVALGSSETVLVMNNDADAPSTMEEITGNPAYMLVLQKFVSTMPDKQRAELEPLIELVHAAQELQNESESSLLPRSISEIYSTHIAEDAPRPVLSLPLELRAQLKEEYRSENSTANSLRHTYDDAMEHCLATLKERCFTPFISSEQFNYVLELRLKEKATASMDDFAISRRLGDGAFGQVVEVVKRDCGKRYAMKIMRKQGCQDVFGDDWAEIVLTERKLMADMHHPLLINLAYAFQNSTYMMLLMDICRGGDLADFGLGGSRRLTARQVHFVGLEVCAVIGFLQSKLVMFRDLKPANLLIDDFGHVRLIDFGIATRSKNSKPPTSDVECGSGVYVAPEITSVFETGKPYSFACDWFSFGVLMYELMEQRYPFGSHPKYANMEKEFVQPNLYDDAETHAEVPHMYDLLAALLDWQPDERLGSLAAGGLAELQAHPYWNYAGFYDEPIDWELVGKRKMASPLRDLAQKLVDSFFLKESEEIEEAQGRRRRMSSRTKGLAEMLKSSEEHEALDPSFGRETWSFKTRVSSYHLQSSKGGGGHSMEEKSRQSFSHDTADDDFDEMYVEGWEFNSPHAIAAEYVERHADHVSVL